MIGPTGPTGLKAPVGVVNSDTPLSTERLQQIAKKTKDFPTTRAAEEYAMATEILARRQAEMSIAGTITTSAEEARQIATMLGAPAGANIIILTSLVTRLREYRAMESQAEQAVEEQETEEGGDE